ncbi:peptidoglycan-binding protein [Spirillospora sp. NPDC048911]|uniref:peptidoglycan-binding protein n=1 Tax=Spirillospora sp. NPDC048911 TaxID=3364527 RepID=UPI0037244432
MQKFIAAVGAVARVILDAHAEQLPTADPVVVREILVGLGYTVPMEPDALTAVVREFQGNAGLRPDGAAGPRTVHALAEACRAVRIVSAEQLPPRQVFEWADRTEGQPVSPAGR